jgi:F0F1-type ATP synthase assembly protein I
MAGERTIRVRFGGDASGVRRAAGQAERAVESFTSKAARVTRAVAATVALGAAMATSAAHAVALGSSVSGAMGAVAAAPAILAAATVAAVAFRVVTFGLGDAWQAMGKKVAGGGGSAVNTARQVAAAQRQVRDATRALTDAQRAARQAQEAVTQARAEETRRLRDLSRNVQEARLDEGDAVDELAAAEKKLAAARGSGDPAAIRLAEREYQRAALTLANVRDRLDDLGAEQAKAAKAGVNGSDTVRAALERQADAQRAVTEAAERLADAQQAVKEASRGAAAGGINPANEALAKLAPNARAVLLTLRSLVPAWQGAARAGQQATFKNVAGDLRDLSRIYLPAATVWLSKMGRAFNVALRQTAGLFKTRDGVRDVKLLTEGTAQATDRLARAVRPVVNGILQFVAVGAIALPGMAGSVGSLADRFERWAITARKTGQAQQWITSGVATLKQFASIAGDVVMSVAAILRAGDDGGSTVDTLARGAAAMRAWLESAQGQAAVADTLQKLRDILAGVAEVVPVLASHGETFNDTLSVTGTVMGFLATHTDTLAKALPFLAAGFIVAKTAQVAANVAAAASIPIQIAQVIVNGSLARQMRISNAALKAQAVANRGAAGAQVAQTVATTAGDVATKRSIISTVAAKAAMIASAIAAKAMAAAQWLLNIALNANPIGLIVLAIIALVAIFVIAYKKSETFRTVVHGALAGIAAYVKFMWEHVWSPVFSAIGGVIKWVAGIVTWWWRNIVTPAFNAVVAVGRWLIQQVVNSFLGWKMIFNDVKGWVTSAKDHVVKKFDDLVGFVRGLPGRVKSAASGLFDGVRDSFRNAINWIIDKWNDLSFTLPSVNVPGLGKVGGGRLDTPNIKRLFTGGNAQRGRSYLVGEKGPEVLTMGPRSGHVTANDELGGDTYVYVTIDGQQLEGRIEKVVRNRDRQLKRRATAAAGTAAGAFA